MLARSVEWPWCVALMVYLLSWLICFRSHQKETASVTTMTRVKGHLLLQIKISVVQVGRDDSDNGEGCIVHHWKTIHSHICTTSCECLFRASTGSFQQYEKHWCCGLGLTCWALELKCSNLTGITFAKYQKSQI